VVVRTRLLPGGARGHGLLDRVRPTAGTDGESYSPRELRLLRRFTTWVKVSPADRLRAMEVLLEDRRTAVGDEEGDRRAGPRRSRGA
jgi:hypothetical protein